MLISDPFFVFCFYTDYTQHIVVIVATGTLRLYRTFRPRPSRRRPPRVRSACSPAAARRLPDTAGEAADS